MPQTALKDPFPLAKGIASVTPLPEPQLSDLWDSIVVDADVKEQLLAQAILNFTLRAKVPRDVIPLHGVIMLVGPPGTGKTSLARGLASRTGESFKASGFQLVEVDPHALTSAALGKSQRAVTDLFSGTLVEYAQSRPTIVLLDEVETLAADRAKLSLEANPIDVHRATDAVLTQLDALATTHTNLLFVATSNFPQAIDRAFRSRCDLVIDVPLPPREACKQILQHCISGLAKVYPDLHVLAQDDALDDLAGEGVGLDGRMLRKAFVNAFALTKETALNPNRLTLTALRTALRAAKASQEKLA